MGSGQHIYKVTEKILQSLIENNDSSIANSYLSLGKKYNLGGHIIKKVLIDSELKRKKRKKSVQKVMKNKN